MCVAVYKCGYIDITYPEQLASKLIVPSDVLKRAIKKFEKVKKIETFFEKKENKRIAKIVKWEEYQSDILISQTKRIVKHDNNESQKDEKQNYTIRKHDTDKIRKDKIRKDKKREEENDGIPPIPKNLDFKIQDNLRNLRAQIRNKKQRLQLTEEELMKKHRITKLDVEKDIEKLTTEFIEIIELHED